MLRPYAAGATVKRARAGRDKPRLERERIERRAAALRENLRKRKAQARAQTHGGAAAPDGTPKR